MTALHPAPFAFDRIFAFTPVEARATSPDLQLQILALRAEYERLQADHVAELALVRTEGFAAGLTQARGERETAMLAATRALHDTLEAVGVAYEEIEQRMSRNVVEVALAAADALAARALSDAPAAALDAAVGRVLHQVGCRQALQVRVHPTLVSEIKRLVAVRQSTERRKLTIAVQCDDTLPIGDGRIYWDQGGLTLSAEARRSAVEAELGFLLPTSDLSQ